MIKITLISLDDTAHAVATTEFADIPFKTTLAQTGTVVEVRSCRLSALDRREDRHDVIVAPGNSYGHMTGGFDEALVWYLGRGLDQHVRDIIHNEYLGELPVGGAFITEYANQVIAYAPTMRIPKALPHNSEAPYLATLAAFIAIHRHNLRHRQQLESVLLPVMGMGTGLLPIRLVARQMQMAIMRALCPTPIDTLGHMGYALDVVINRR